jgi:hypothetical protein
MGLIGLTKSNPHFMKGFVGNEITSFAMLFVLDFMFVNNYHKFGNIGEHPCALLATNSLHIRSREL